MAVLIWPVGVPDTYAEQQKREAIAGYDRSELLDREPDCSCRQTDVDLFDARGCELHDPSSSWNSAVRAVTDAERHDLTEFTNEDRPF